MTSTNTFHIVRLVRPCGMCVFIKGVYMNTRSEYGRKKVVWQLQEAKAMFSEVIKAAAEKPQTVTTRGKETAVVLSIEEYKRLVRPRQTLFEFIQNSPLCDVTLELPRRLPEKMRDINL